MKQIPVVFCEPYGKSSLRFWCEHCQGWHSHGAGGDDGGEGHRVAHCHNPKSPYRDTGYILKIVSREPVAA